MSYDPEDLMFVVGATIQGLMTEIWMLDKKKVLAQDPDGLQGVDTSRVLGLPYQYNKTLEGHPGLSSFMGTAEEARKALEAAGVQEAPVTIDVDRECLAYVTKNYKKDGLYGIEARCLHHLETVEMGGVKATKIFFYHRFPGEEDWVATLESLPPVVAASIPHLDENGTFITLMDPDMLTGWLEQGKVAKDLTR
jgi:hypothetical protein